MTASRAGFESAPDPEVIGPGTAESLGAAAADEDPAVFALAVEIGGRVIFRVEVG